jgi:hypothetical protein
MSGKKGRSGRKRKATAAPPQRERHEHAFEAQPAERLHELALLEFKELISGKGTWVGWDVHYTNWVRAARAAWKRGDADGVAYYLIGSFAQLACISFETTRWKDKVVAGVQTANQRRRVAHLARTSKRR